MPASPCRQANKSPNDDRILFTPSPPSFCFQETTARLLFVAVRWVRCRSPFQTLCKRDQMLLLQETWKDLFILHLANWSIPWDLSALFHSTSRDEEAASALAAIQEVS